MYSEYTLVLHCITGITVEKLILLKHNLHCKEVHFFFFCKGILFYAKISVCVMSDQCYGTRVDPGMSEVF